MTERMATITLHPSGRQIEAAAGTPLRDVLFAEGVEFPCGGRGRCGACKVKVSGGELAGNETDRAALAAADIAAGWRLACAHGVEPGLTLEIAQWEMTVLGDGESFPFVPRQGLGIAIDLGTTTLAAQLLDLQTGAVLASQTALNAQARHGADVLSRAGFALAGGGAELTRLIRDQLGAMVAALAQGATVARIVIAGNSAMHHLFGGLDIAPLATHPFLPVHPEALTFAAANLGWPDAATVDVLPCIGGLVGGDVLAGIAATDLHHRPGLTALVDLGTNGEVVVAKDGAMLCTSTAAGPAFEGARIRNGMRAATGAIDVVEIRGNAIACRVIGGGRARGLCGSGLVDAVAAGLDLSVIAANGRLKADWPLKDDVGLIPQDVRELQLAKGAIAAGLRLLTARFGATPADLDTLYLAGAFGNAVSRTAAVRIGLIKAPVERIVPAGNTALKGAKRALFAEPGDLDELARAATYVPLAEEPHFQDVFAAEMGFEGTWHERKSSS
jgi:uncharacterized 2Fe-2S/4Fe-4S cluster protein (DUF4445 family)